MQFSAFIASTILGFVAASPIAAPAPAPTSYDLSGVNWATVNYNVDWKTVDYSHVDWNTIDWNSVFGNKAAAATPAAKADSTTLTTATATATAAPTSDSSTFTLVSIKSGSDLQYSPVHASAQKLQLGGDLSTSTSPAGVPVPQTNVTSFTTGSQNGLSLNVVVPGGQQVFVNADGVLGYTTPHSGVLPTGAITTGFSLSNNDLQFNGKQQFVACPVGASGLYDIAVQEKVTQNSCVGIALRATTGTVAPAWQW